jgi:hypothetical protein
VDHHFWHVVQEQQLQPFHWQKVQVLGPFVEANLYIGLYTRIRRSPTFPQCCSWMRLASLRKGF